MRIQFEVMNKTHEKAIMEIFNYYIENSFAAFPNFKLPQKFFEKLLEKSVGYPAYTVKNEDSIIGFCFLSPYNPFPTFKETAEISYFIAPKYVSQGIGKICLDKLEEEAVRMGIKSIVAHIASKNNQSLAFHQKHGFLVCGSLKNVGKKHGEYFDIIIMQKNL